ncbi:MAG: helix-turn-helix transcriptional regulator [Gammaproteobacteria bacterium]
MSAQIIEKNGKAEFAVVPIDEYNLLLEKAEELDDVTAFDKAMHELQVGQDELVPAEVAKRLVSGKESALKVWREYRRMTQEQLAAQAGISQGQVALIEGDKREGTVSVLKGLVNALHVDLDDLV